MHMMDAVSYFCIEDFGLVAFTQILITYENHFQWIAQGTHTAVMGRLVTTMSVLVLKIQSAQTLRNVKMGNAKKQVVTPYHVVQMQPVKCLTMILHVNVILDTTLLPHQRMVVVS